MTSAHLPQYRPFGTFRLGLAMLVLLQHCLLLLPMGCRGIFYDLELGALAVTTFFALSGFIVAEALGSFYGGRPAAFLANRVLRIVPPYLAVLLVTLVVESWLFSLGRLVPLDAKLSGAPWQWRVLLASICEIVPGLPAHRISGQDFSFIPFAWTLRIEFAFYVSAVAVTALAAYVAREDGKLRRRMIAGVVFAGYALFATFALRNGQGSQQLLCIPFFGFGLGVFLFRERPGPVSTLHLCALAALVPVAFTFWRQHGHPVPGYQLPLLCGLFLAAFTLSGMTRLSGRLQRLDKRLGDLSYALYIGHGFVLVVLCSLSTHPGWRLYWSGVAGALAFAVLLHATTELPLRHARDRLRGVPV